MASLSLYPQSETNLMSNRKVIELLVQLKSAKGHGKNYIKIKPHLVHHLLRNRQFQVKKSVFVKSPGAHFNLKFSTNQKFGTYTTTEGLWHKNICSIIF